MKRERDLTALSSGLASGESMRRLILFAGFALASSDL